jgi:hypothetical protein
MSASRKPDRQAIEELTVHLRAVRTVGWSKHLDRPSDNGQHLAKNLNRNFAVLQLCLDNGSAIGLGWLGVSGDPGYSPPAILKDPVVLASESGSFSLNVKAIFGFDEDHIIDPLFEPLPEATLKCSEVPLLNGLGYRMSITNFPQEATGCLYLLTERLPCKSCGQVIRQFRQAYPNLQIHLLYMFDHTDHASERLATDLSDFADSVQLIEVIDDGDNGFMGSTGAVFGSANNPVQSTPRGGPATNAQAKSLGITINVLPVSARKPGDLVVVPTSEASKVISRGAGSPSAHFISNILTNRSQKSLGKD